MTAVYLDDTRITLAPADLLGQGGEAEVYDLHDGRVLKWWKPATHADFDGLPDQQAAATARLASAPARLHALRQLRLPTSVVAPVALAHARKHATGDVVGYVMPKVDNGTAFHCLGEPRWRRDNPATTASDVVAMLLALHTALAELHRAGAVVGDCNDHNVLVDLATRAVHLIDVDSYQLPGHPCAMFSERFVDPRLCPPTALQPIHPHDTHSDWFAFAVMAFRSLLQVSPWGGVHPKTPASRRTLARVSVLAPGIVYPRASRPIATLPDEVLEVFRAIFDRDDRGVFPRDLLAGLRFRRCPSCGDEHARTRCPTCQTAVQLPPTTIHGRLRHQPITLADVATHTFELTGTTRPVWLDGDALMRGENRIGTVLAGHTRAWCGASLGVGFYRAGGYAVGFTFRPDRGQLDDRVVLPKLRGRLVDAHAVCGADRAWLFLVTEHGTHVLVVDDKSRTLASETIDAPWLTGLYGAVAAGPHLFVPTDDGVARIEITANSISYTRTFAETSLLISSGDRLALHASGLDAIRAHDVLRMHLS